MRASRPATLDVLVGLVLVAAGLAAFGMTIGTPHVRTGPTVIRVDLTDALRRVPPVDCSYAGIQGARHLRFEDADHCPALMLLPARAGR